MTVQKSSEAAVSRRYRALDMDPGGAKRELVLIFSIPLLLIAISEVISEGTVSEGAWRMGVT